MATCRKCGETVPQKRRYCDLHRAEERLASRRDSFARKIALKPEFEARGLFFSSYLSLRELHAKLGEPAPHRPRVSRVTIEKPKRRRIFYRGPRFCANPACGDEFMPKRKDQIYCYGGEVDCRGQMARIKRETLRRIAFAQLPGESIPGSTVYDQVFKQIVSELRQRREGASFTHV